MYANLIVTHFELRRSKYDSPTVAIRETGLSEMAIRLPPIGTSSYDISEVDLILWSGGFDKVGVGEYDGCETVSNRAV